MADELVVVLGGNVAGTVTRFEHNRLQFEYDEAYRERPDATPLSLSMPIQVRSHGDDRRRQVVTNYPALPGGAVRLKVGRQLDLGEVAEPLTASARQVQRVEDGLLGGRHTLPI